MEKNGFEKLRNSLGYDKAQGVIPILKNCKIEHKFDFLVILFIMNRNYQKENHQVFLSFSQILLQKFLLQINTDLLL
jgi:hypothetical protein